MTAEMFNLTLSNELRTVNSTFNGLVGIKYILPRIHLIESLKKIVQKMKSQFTILSAPAATGKTSAIHLLIQSLKDDYLSNGLFFPIQCARSSLTLFQQLSNIGLTYDKKNLAWKTSNLLHGKRVIIFLNDAHCQYDDQDFWAILMKGTCQLPQNIQFIIAATYLLGGTRSPVEFDNIQTRIQLPEMLLNTDEAIQLLKINLPEIMQNYDSLMTLIERECGGNIGALSKAANFLLTQFKLNLNIDLSEENAIHLYLSRDLLSAMVRCFGTLFPSFSDNKGTHERILLAKLLRCKTLGCEFVNDVVKDLVECGILVIDAEIKFASRLAQRFFMNKFYHFRASDNPSSLIELVKLAIGSISTKMLTQSVAGTTDFPMESTIQHLFLTALAAHTTPTTSICPELSKLFPIITESNNQAGGIISGEIDFYLNGTLRWGIELLISGRRFGEHFERFDVDRKYYPLQMNDYIVVDFRPICGSSSSSILRHPKRLTVFFEDDFSKCQCLYGVDLPSFQLNLAL
jgi:hypothetical protein